MAPLGNQRLVLLAVRHGDYQALLALGVLAETDRAAGLCEDRRLFRLPRLEQVGDARQTTGDVTGFRGLLRDAGEHVTDADLRIVVDPDHGTTGQEVVGWQGRTNDIDIIALVINQLDHRTQLFTAGRSLLRIKYDDRRQARHIVGLLLYGDAFDEIDKSQRTRNLGDHRVGVRIPTGDQLAALDRVSVTHHEHGTVRQLVTLALAAHLVGDHDLTRTRHRHQVAVGMLHGLDVVQPDSTGVLDLDAVHGRRTRRGTTDMEGTHRELGTGLTDRLGRDNADRLTDVHLVTARQIAPVTLSADAVARLTGDRGTHHDLVYASLFEQVHPAFVKQRTAFADNFVAARAHDIHRGHTTEDALAQWLDDIAALDNRLHHQALIGTTVDRGDDHVLGNIDQTTGQIPGVGGLERRIGETLTRTVGRDEVLKYVQTLAEVGSDRRLDDRAVRLGHQATHTGQLADLRGRTTRPGVGHHIDGVERILLDLLAFAIGDPLLAELSHHRARHLVIGVRPDVHHLVVALTVCDQTGGVLVFDLFYLGLCRSQDLRLLRRDDHVVDTDGDARTSCLAEPEVHQLVGKNHRVFEAKSTIAGIDQARDGLLGHRLVDQVERQPLGHDVPHQRTAYRGVFQ